MSFFSRLISCKNITSENNIKNLRAIIKTVSVVEIGPRYSISTPLLSDKKKDYAAIPKGIKSPKRG